MGRVPLFNRPDGFGAERFELLSWNEDTFYLADHCLEHFTPISRVAIQNEEFDVAAFVTQGTETMINVLGARKLARRRAAYPLNTALERKSTAPPARVYSVSFDHSTPLIQAYYNIPHTRHRSKTYSSSCSLSAILGRS